MKLSPLEEAKADARMWYRAYDVALYANRRLDDRLAAAYAKINELKIRLGVDFDRPPCGLCGRIHGRTTPLEG